MCRTMLYVVALAVASSAPLAARAQDADLSKIRDEIRQLKEAYEKRIEALEKRLQAAETRAAGAEQSAARAESAAQTVARRKPAVIDLTEVDFMGSIGIGMLIGIAKSMKAQGAGMAVVATATGTWLASWVGRETGPLIVTVAAAAFLVSLLRRPA